MTNATNAWFCSPIIEKMSADHCRQMTAMGPFVLARLGWSDADIRAMARKAGA